MTPRYTPVDLSGLPPPPVVEPLDFERILAGMKADLARRWPEFSAGEAEPEPAVKVLEVCAYREVLLRQRVNDAARAVMLSSAGGADLDQLAALLAVGRLAGEGDESLRRRAQLAPERWSTAGPTGAYEALARAVSSAVKDVAVRSPNPGEVLVTVLGATGSGVPDQELLDAVEAALSAETVRPVCDQVTVAAATVATYEVEATVAAGDGPDAEAVRAASEAAVRGYVRGAHRLGSGVPLSALYAALHAPGVTRVTLTKPAAEVAATASAAPWCEAVAVALA